MRKGDFVKCIDNTSYKKELTIGKAYTVALDSAADSVYILNNLGAKFGFKMDRFRVLSLNEKLIYEQFEIITNEKD